MGVLVYLDTSKCREVEWSIFTGISFLYSVNALSVLLPICNIWTTEALHPMTLAVLINAF